MNGQQRANRDLEIIECRKQHSEKRVAEWFRLTTRHIRRIVAEMKSRDFPAQQAAKAAGLE